MAAAIAALLTGVTSAALRPSAEDAALDADIADGSGVGGFTVREQEEFFFDDFGARGRYELSYLYSEA